MGRFFYVKEDSLNFREGDVVELVGDIESDGCSKYKKIGEDEDYYLMDVRTIEFKEGSRWEMNERFGTSIREGDSVYLAQNDGSHIPWFSLKPDGSNEFYLNLKRLRPYEGEKMTSTDYKVKAGDVVVVNRDGVDTAGIAFQIYDNEGLSFISRDHFFPLAGYEIIKAYQAKNNMAMQSIIQIPDHSILDRSYDYELLYKKEDEIKELTIEEIASKFNIDASQVRIKE